MKIAEKKLRQIIKESVREVVKGQLNEFESGRPGVHPIHRDMRIFEVLEAYASDLRKVNTYAELSKAGRPAGDGAGPHSQFQYAMRICRGQFDSRSPAMYPKTCAAVQEVKLAMDAAMARAKANEKKVRTP